MSQLQINYRPRVISNSCVHVVRKIKGIGQLSVVKNQEVSPHDVLGTSSISPGFSVINISRELGVGAKAAIKSLQKPLGVPIYKGELLARKKGLLGSKNIIAPTDCVIDKVNETTGEITLRLLPHQQPLLSGVFGIVDELNPLTGEVFIKTMATQVIGLFGSGRERGGFLHISGNPSDLINPRQITSQLRGQIVVTGGLIFGEALKKAMEAQLDGIISGGINMDDYLSIAGSLYEQKKSHSDIGMSIVATEGFGPVPIGEDIYRTLWSFQGKFIFINGFLGRVILPNSSEDSLIQARKISLPRPTSAVSTDSDIRTIPLRLGLKVRVIWPPFMGYQGIISAIDAASTRLESGISTYMVVIETSSKKIKVPFTNVEAIGS